MPKRATCPSCQQAMLVPDELTGQSIRCPKCRAVVPASTDSAAASAQPAASARRPSVRTAKCPRCAKAFGVQAGTLRQRVACPHCRAELLVQEEAGRVRVLPTAVHAAAATTGADPLGFLTSGLGAKALNPSGGVLKKESGSRYRARRSEKAAASDDCMIRCFLCGEDASVGLAVAKALRDILKKEDCFTSVSVSSDSDQWGRKVTYGCEHPIHSLTKGTLPINSRGDGIVGIVAAAESP